MVNEKKFFSILYLEDDEKDVKLFAEEVRFAVQEMTGKPDNRTINHETLIRFLDEWGIQWVRDEEVFLKEARENEYRLMIIDLFFEDKRDALGMTLVEKLEDHPIKGDPLVWILSRLSHYRVIMTNQAKVHRFFCKDSKDFNIMRNLLVKIFGSQREATDEELEFMSPYQEKMIIKVSQIIAIDVTSIGSHKQYRQRRIYCIDPVEVFARTEFVGGRYDLIKDVLHQVKKKNMRDLLQISRTIIINIRHIKKIEVRKKNYYLTMSQCGDNIESQIKVGGIYQVALSKVLGMELF